MIINWKKDCIKTLPTKDKGMKLLLPGVNEITQAEWEFAKPSLEDVIKAGMLEEMEIKTQSGPNKPVKVADSVIELDSKKAKSLIDQTNNGETLNMWLSKENRPDVRRYIEDRMTVLKIDKKEIEDTEDEVVEKKVIKPTVSDKE